MKVTRSTSVAVRVVPGTMPSRLVSRTFRPTSSGEDPRAKTATSSPGALPGTNDEVTSTPLSVAWKVSGLTASPPMPNLTMTPTGGILVSPSARLRNTRKPSTAGRRPPAKICVGSTGTGPTVWSA